MVVKKAKTKVASPAKKVAKKAAKVSTKKATPKASTPKKTVVKKAVVKKVVKKTTTKKEAPKRTETKKTVKRTSVKKVAVKKEPTKKVVVKKAIAPKKRVSATKKVLVEVADMKDVSEEFVLTKYETGAHTHYADNYRDPLETEDLPYCYDLNRVVMLPVDPTFAFLYWEVREDTLNSMFQQFGYDSKLSMRVYDVTNIEFNGLNANEWWDIEVYNRIGTWYLKHYKGDRNLVVDIGVLSADGNFHVIYRSKTMYFQGIQW